MTSEHAAALGRLKSLLPDEVILHIGMTKAGSTAIQNAFAKNSDFLLSHGVFFPTSILRRSNSLFPARTSGHLQFFKRLEGLEHLIAEASISGPPARRAFFSAENIFLDLDAESYAAIRELFARKSVTLFCILRPQPDWLCSRYFESVVKGKLRETATFEGFVQRLMSGGQLDYDRRLDELQGLLGASDVIAADYDAIMHKGGSVRAALDLLKIGGELPNALSEHESNISNPSTEAVEAQRQLNLLTPALTPDQYMAWSARMEAAGAIVRSEASALTMAPDLLHHVVEACRDSNERLSLKYLGGAPFGQRDVAASGHGPMPQKGLVARLLETGINELAPFVADAARESAERLREKDRPFRKEREARRTKSQLGNVALTVSSLERESSELHSTLDAARSKLRLVSHDLEAEKYQTAALQGRLRDLESQFEAEKSDAAFLREQVRDLERELETTNSSANSLRDQLNNLQGELETEKFSEALLRERLGSLQRQLGEREGMMKDAQSALKESDKKLARIRRDLRQTREELAQVRTELASIKSQPLKFVFGPMIARFDVGRKNTISRAERSVLLSNADLFDPGWYLSRYPDVAATRSDPLTHYLRFGAAEGRDPSAAFSTSGYLHDYPDVERSGMNPLLHYLRFGRQEGRESRRAHHDGKARVTPSRLSEKARKAAEKQIKTLFDNGRAGFFDAAVSGLRTIAEVGEDTPEIKELAAFHLALLLFSDNQEENAEAVLELLAAHRSSSDMKTSRRRLHLAALVKAGRVEEARREVDVLLGDEKRTSDPDLLLVGSSVLAAVPDREAQRTELIAQAFAHAGGVEFCKKDESLPLSFDNMSAPSGNGNPDDCPLVSVVMPAHNAERFILTSIQSILAQSWTNLELLVVDDASTDGTFEIVRAVSERDPRVRVIRLDDNSGAYVARNTGLSAARGEFVTCQDSDDWSHPERIACQANDLMTRREIVANTSLWARATDDLAFPLRPYSVRLMHMNPSSVMFRREAVLDRVGYWDSVRFGADMEFWQRLKLVFGDSACHELPRLLALGRIVEGSLTRSPGSEFLGSKVGARKAYFQAHSAWHQRGPELRMDFPLRERPFGVPRRMLPRRGPAEKYDVVLLSDFRHSGGTSASNVQEIRAQVKAGLKTGIVQVDRYDLSSVQLLHPDVQSLIDAGDVDVIVHGDDVETKLATIRFPAIFYRMQRHLPKISANHIRVIVNQPPRKIKGGPPLYSIEECKRNIASYLGSEGEWVPIGPAVRAALEEDGQHHHLSSENWFNVIDVDDWRLNRNTWAADRPIIGRHGRDSVEKWPTSAKDILAAYPDDGSVGVRILGGASVPVQRLGYAPENWEVIPFNDVPPRDFLHGIDFFVFFPHEERIEAFGRTIIEAMAAGCLVILPPMFSELFGKAAVYCSPAESSDVVWRYYRDRDAYDRFVNNAFKEVRAQFGFEQHVARVTKIIGCPAKSGSEFSSSGE